MAEQLESWMAEGRKKYLLKHGVAKELVEDATPKQLELMAKNTRHRIAQERLMELVKADPLEVEHALFEIKKDTGFTIVALRKMLEELSEPKADQEQPKMDEDKKDEVISFLRHEDILEEFSKDFAKMHVGDVELAQHHFLSGINLGFIGDAIHINASGGSGKGKSSLQKKVASHFFSKSRVGILSNLSPKAIQYKGDVDNNIIVIDDANLKDEDKITTLRSLTSNEEERALKNWTVIDQEFVELEVKGKCCVWLSNVDVAQDAQLANRFQIDCVDETVEQDTKVFDYKRENFALGESSSEREGIYEKWREITDVLLSEKDFVIIPYFAFKELLTWENIEDRRLFPQFAVLVASITKAYKYQREKDKLGRLIATRQDFELALRIWDRIGAASASKLSDAARRVYGVLSTEHKTVSSIANEIGKSTNAVRYNLKILVDKSMVNSEQDETGRRTWAYWTVDKKLPSSSIKFDWDKLTLERMLENVKLVEVIPNIKDIYASLCLPPKPMVRSEEIYSSIAKGTLETASQGYGKVGEVVPTNSGNDLPTPTNSENSHGKVENNSSDADLTRPYHDLTKDFSKVNSLPINNTTTTLPYIQRDIQKREGIQLSGALISKMDNIILAPESNQPSVKTEVTTYTTPNGLEVTEITPKLQSNISSPKDKQDK
jgi:predicted transcriptional regulator/uncharacterized DUF497 family protein